MISTPTLGQEDTTTIYFLSMQSQGIPSIFHYSRVTYHQLTNNYPQINKTHYILEMNILKPAFFPFLSLACLPTEGGPVVASAKTDRLILEF